MSVLSDAFDFGGIHSSSELQVLWLVQFAKHAVAGVVYDEEIVGSVMLLGEIADAAVELELRLGAQVKFDGLGTIVEAISEQSLELLCLVAC